MRKIEGLHKMKWLLVLIFTLTLELLSVGLYGYWETKVMPGDINEMFIPLAIGDARNDGLQRIYGTEFQTVYSSETVVLEYSWNGSLWNKTVVFSTFTRYGHRELSGEGWTPNGDLVIPTMAVGDGHNDGKNYLYVGYLGQGGMTILEFSWAGSSWTATKIETGSISGDGDSHADSQYDIDYEHKKPIILCLGDVRNDGKNRLYAGTGASELYEYSWSGSNWSRSFITGPFLLGLFGPWEIDGLVIADGRNDGVNRLYVQAGGYSPYTISMAVKKMQQQIPDENLDEISKPRNFGVYKLSEFTWNSGLSTWEEVVISSSTHSKIFHGGLFVEDARNDGVKRIYIHGMEPRVWTKGGGTGTEYEWFGKYYAQNVQRIIEYTFNKSKSCWERKKFWYEQKFHQYPGVGLVFFTDYPNYFIVSIADARGDGIKRIYVDFNGAWKNSYLKIGYVDKQSSPDEIIKVMHPWGRMGELTWDGEGWDFQEIDNRFIMSFLAGEGHNDGIVRAYSAGGFEYTYNPIFTAKVSMEYLVPVNNYFNPLRGERTTVVYKPIRDGNMSLKIYTLHGRLVRTLYSGYGYQGEYGIPWDGTNDSGQIVASGIYLVHMEALGISQTKKICVLK